MRTVNSKFSIALHCLVFIFEYGEQAKVTSTLLSITTGCNPVIIRNILSALKKAGIVFNPKGIGGAKLALPPDQLTLADIYAAIAPEGGLTMFGFHANPSKLCPVGRCIHTVLETPYHELEASVVERMRTMRFQDVLDGYHRIPVEER